MRNRIGYILALLAALGSLTACHRAPDPGTVTMLIENSPTSLDPRIGTDGQSEHIDSLLFDSLVRRNEHFEVDPWLAKSWDHPDPLTYVFHLVTGVRFSDGRPLTSADVKWTLDSTRNNLVPTVKAAAYRSVASVEAPDPATVVLRLNQPDPSLLMNLSDGAMGVVPAGSGRDFARHPIGSGSFRFVSQEQDKEVVIERNPLSWQLPPRIARVRFSVVPDTITRALELEKGSADVAVNALTADILFALSHDARVVVESGPGTVVNYLNFNTRDPILKDARVRRAIALAIDRPLIVHALWRDRARLAASLLPPTHWACTDDVDHYPYDPARANALLDAAGYKRGRDGMRFRLAIKTSTDETSRLLAVVLQQQLAAIGIALDVRTFEFATFLSDVSKGAFQIYGLRWLGGNEDPDIFRYAYQTASFPPKGANRGFYSNPVLDRLIDDARAAPDEAARRADYVKVQQILAADVPSINLWYLDTVLVHSPRLHGVSLSQSGNFDFLREAWVQ